MSWRDCSGFYDDGVMTTRCTAQAGCGMLGCPAEGVSHAKGCEWNPVGGSDCTCGASEIKGPSQPIRIGASIPVSMLREKFLAGGGLAPVIKLGREIFGDDLTDAQIIAISGKEATLRGFTPTLTYHDQPCATCRGLGFLTSHGEPGRQISRRELSNDPSCPTCGGDGFAPPIERTETEDLRRKVGR